MPGYVLFHCMLRLRIHLGLPTFVPCPTRPYAGAYIFCSNRLCKNTPVTTSTLPLYPP